MCTHVYKWLSIHVCLPTWLRAGILERNVQLDEDGDALEPYSFMNYLQQADGTMYGVEVGMYNLRRADLDGPWSPLNLRVEEVQWPGNTSAIPVDTAGLVGFNGFWCCLAFNASFLPSTCPSRIPHLLPRTLTSSLVASLKSPPSAHPASLAIYPFVWIQGRRN